MTRNKIILLGTIVTSVVLIGGLIFFLNTQKVVVKTDTSTNSGVVTTETKQEVVETIVKDQKTLLQEKLEKLKSGSGVNLDDSQVENESEKKQQELEKQIQGTIQEFNKRTQVTSSGQVLDTIQISEQALKTNDLILCEKLGKEGSISCKQQIVTQLALEKKDILECEKQTTYEQKQECKKTYNDKYGEKKPIIIYVNGKAVLTGTGTH